MLNLLVTGARGQVGSELEVLSGQYPYTFYFTDREQLDITKQDKVRQFIMEQHINVIINCAAYTAVDKAEKEPILSNNINFLAVKSLAEIAKEREIKLIHLSTDYVFSGENFRPYCEEDISEPLDVYAQTKFKGENSILNINPEHSIIIRTGWLYSSFGSNFVKTILGLGREKREIGVVFDQIGTPTYAKDLAKVILDILPKIDNKNVEIYHYTNEGVASWYDFAVEIMDMAQLECKVNAIETKEYPTPAKRPHFSLLNKNKIKNTFGITLPYWKNSLKECLQTIGEKNNE